ncbi:putative major facilitator superfamily transporter [Gordonia effusa NBRC 100432]|uniref:Putative major facilitator superfamily transporter n=1 Tax=Gordonia effusa NBRC 100432 TaxID=1077974 RepID=H0QX18_9ACTN|nr:putative major facilitator superfamily transporter [Gordonia effusa NBRC 100432]
MFASLAIPNYRTYFIGAVVSNIGTWIQRVAQDWLVLQLSGGSAVAVGITTALQFLPALVLSPVGGLLADRMDKRILLAITQTWMALSALVLGVLAVTGVATTWHVYAVALIFGIGSALDVPARQSFVTEVAGRKHLTNAIGLNSTSFNVARLIGPGLAGLIIAVWGSGWAILTNALSYVAMLIALALLDASKLERSAPTARAKGQLREGFRYVADRPELLIALGVGFSVGTFALNFQLTNAVMVQQEFHLGAQSYGILGSVMGIGSLLGALLAARRQSAPRLRFVLGTAVIFGLILAVSGLTPTYLTYALSLPIVGLAGLLTMTATNMFVQTNADDHVRGRVMALYTMVMMGGTPLGSPMMGWLAEAFGPRAPLIGGAVLQLATIALVVAAVGWYSRRRGLAQPTDLDEQPVGAPARRAPDSDDVATL